MIRGGRGIRGAACRSTFGDRVRARCADRGADDADVGAGEDASKARTNLASRSRIRNPQPTQIDRQEPAQRAERRDRSASTTDFRLDFTEARELGTDAHLHLQWITGPYQPQLAASLHWFMGVDGYDLTELSTDLARFAFRLGEDDGEPLFGTDQS